MSISAVSIPVHDNVLLSYSVSAREKEIRFHTAALDDKSHEYLGVIFSDVIAYHSKQDGFRDGWKHTGPVMCESKEDLLRRTHEEGVRASDRHAASTAGYGRTA